MGAPCLTFDFALGKLTGQRDVIKVLGAFDLGSTGLSLVGKSLVIDGNMSTLSMDSAGTIATLSLGSTVTFEGFTFQTVSSSTPVSVGAGTAATVFECVLAQGADVQNGTMTISHSQVVEQRVACEASGTLVVDQSKFAQTNINSDSCHLTVNRSEFDETGSFAIDAAGGLIEIENNLITSTSQFSDAVSVTSGGAGSYYRLNTMFNTSGVVDTASVLTCDSTIAVTSNIIAWGTTVEPTCLTTYTLFDTNLSQTGTGNLSKDSSTFFVNSGTGDFHLSASSPARGAGDPSLTVPVDFDGAPRPNPAGTPPDIGCYEAP